MTTKTDVLKTVDAVVTDMVDDYANTETDRGVVLDRVFDEVDTAFGQLVRHGLITDYDAQDMVSTAPACCVIIEAAAAVTDPNEVANNSGLWGCQYGNLAVVAFHSLENLICSALEAAGVDTNDDFPFAAKEETETA